VSYSGGARPDGAFGVTMIGIALVLRDLVQRRLGVGVAVVAITVGAALSSIMPRPRWSSRRRSHS